MIRLLGNVREELLKKFTIHLPLEKLNPEMLNQLTKLSTDFPGNTLLRFLLSEDSTRISVGLFSRKQRINVTSEWLDALENLGLEYQVNQ